MEKINKSNLLVSSENDLDNEEKGQIIQSSSSELEKSDSELSFVEEAETEVEQSTPQNDDIQDSKVILNSNSSSEEQNNEQFPVSLQQAQLFLKDLLKAYYTQKIIDKQSLNSAKPKVVEEKKKKAVKSVQKKLKNNRKSKFSFARIFYLIVISILVSVIAFLIQSQMNERSQYQNLLKELDNTHILLLQSQEYNLELTQQLSNEQKISAKLKKKNIHLQKQTEYAINEEKRNCDLLDVKDIFLSTFKFGKHHNIIQLCQSYDKYLKLEYQETQEKADNHEDDDKNDDQEFFENTEKEQGEQTFSKQSEKKESHSQKILNKLNSIKSSFFGYLNQIPSLKMSSFQNQEEENNEQSPDQNKGEEKEQVEAGENKLAEQEQEVDNQIISN